MSTLVQRGTKVLSQLTILGGLGAFLIPTFTFSVPPGHRAVLFDRYNGVKPETYREGIHFKVPWLYVPHVMDVRITPTEIPTITGAKDLQQVSVNLRILSRPQIERLPDMWNQVGSNYNEKVLPSFCNEVLKAVVAQYPAEQLITQREAISREVREALSYKTQQYGIILDDVSLVHIGFSPDFAKAIEEKQVAEQTAERARYVVDRADQERQATIIRAEADAEAAELIARAIAKHGDGLLQIRRIETAKDVVASLADKPNVTYLPSDINPMLVMGGSNNVMNNNKKM